MSDEPTLEQLEKLLSTYRKIGGSDSEVALLTREIVYNYLPDQAKPLEDIFDKDDHLSVKKIRDFKKLELHPMKHAASDTWSKKWFRYPFLFFSIFFVIFILLNFPLIAAKVLPADEEVAYETVQEVIRPSQEQSAPLASGEVVPKNDTLVVPKIGVRAPIVYAASANEKMIQEDLRKGVVHYPNTGYPGEAGNAFITGHSSNYWWEKGNYNYVFANLDRLNIGDQAVIYYQGKKLVYSVTSKKVVPPTDVSVLAQTPKPTMTLMTCTPPGTNWRRLIVKFDQVSPQYVAPQVVERQQDVNTSALPGNDKSGFMDWIYRIFAF